ncbi:type III secretion protein [Pseudomonas aylmerensis]|nr:type III secretion protein [Pseudomonas aylmerensis]
MSCHNDWAAVDRYVELRKRIRSHQECAANIYGIVPCLPPNPQPTLLKLALASTDQLELALALIDSTCRHTQTSVLDESQNQWCTRLSKTLPLDILQPDDDPLQLLRTWVPSETWQRIRLRFPRSRILELEKQTFLLDDSLSRLDTLWQAVVWRIAPSIAPDSKEPGD